MSLTEIAGGRAVAVCGVSISFPGSTYRVATAPFSSLGSYHYAGKILGWSRIRYALSDRSGRLPAVETSIRVDDTDRTVARIYAGTSADSVRGSAATAYLMAPGTASASWTTLFTGVVSRVSFPAPFVAEIGLRCNDDVLQRPSGRLLNRVDWPNAKAEVFDQAAPILYGSKDAATFRTGPGLVPTLLVDTVLFRYLVCAGKAKTLHRVYKDGVEIASSGSTDYGGAFTYVTKSGRIYTTLTFTQTQGDSVITCDADGYESVGDGSGSVITNPATQWAHRLSNFVLGDWKTGAWLSTSTLIDSTTLTAAQTYFTSLGASGSDYDAQRRTGSDIIARFCHSWRMRSYWTPAGKVAIGYENIFAAAHSGTRLRWYRDELGEFNLVEDDWRVTSHLAVRQSYSPSDSAYLATLDVQDPGPTNETTANLDLELSRAS